MYDFSVVYGSIDVGDILDIHKYLMKNHKILFWAYNSIIKSITGSLIIFEKPRKMTNDFFNKEIICHLSWFLENDQASGDTSFLL